MGNLIDDLKNLEPVTAKIYTDDEIESAMRIIAELHNQCEMGRIDQHASPALLIAIDCIAEVLQNRKGE